MTQGRSVGNVGNVRQHGSADWAPSIVLTGLLTVAQLNGIGLGVADAPLPFVRQFLYLPVTALAFLIGRRQRVHLPALPLAVAALVAVGATVVDGLGQGLTMVLFGALTVGLPWLIGQALRHQGELVVLAQERAEQVEATRDAYALAAAVSLRQQIAEDLHDHVGHDLALIAVQAGILETTTCGSTREGATRLRQLASDATDRLRDYVGDLTEVEQELHSVSDVARRAASTGLLLTIDGDSENPLFVRAALEALTNAARHATGQSVHLSATTTSLLVTNRIVDGAAINTSTTTGHRQAPGRGLTLLTARVEGAGGELHAGRDGNTWRLSVHLPPPS